MGIILGAVGTSFYYCIESATFFRENHSWIILFLPLAGAAIIYFYNAMGYPKDKGTNLVLLAVRDNEKMGLKHTVSIYVASVITHLFGGSSGREGANPRYPLMKEMESVVINSKSNQLDNTNN